MAYITTNTDLTVLCCGTRPIDDVVGIDTRSGAASVARVGSYHTLKRSFDNSTVLVCVGTMTTSYALLLPLLLHLIIRRQSSLIIIVQETIPPDDGMGGVPLRTDQQQW